jgi:thiosulfate/3-mercaptopyruvate sulfurtransferase
MTPFPPDTLVLDARPAGAWSAGHWAGALDADLDRFLSTAGDPGFDPAPRGRHPLPPIDRWARQLGAWGLGPQTKVAVYDGARGTMGACRLWWMLKASGHGPVEVLEGSLEAVGAGAIWTTEVTPALAALPPYPVTAWSWPMVDADEAEAFASDPGRLLIDVRSPERWRGEVEPLDPVAGHIPGSVNVFLENNLRPDGRFKSAAELRRLYAPVLAGRDPSRVAVHCGSGVSACHTIYALEKAGFHGASLYVGSYSQWCRTGRPIATARAGV